MILEVAILDVKPGLVNEFEIAFKTASSILSSMPGYTSHELQRCIENANRYILLVHWQTLENHTVGFRQSPEYQEWRSLLHHFYDPFPVVEHYEMVVQQPLLNDRTHCEQNVMPEDNSQVMLILQLEASFLQADIRNSEKEVSALLADEFIEFGSSGRVYDKQQAIESLQNEPKEAMPQRAITDFKVSVLAAGVILVSYRTISTSCDASMDSLRSSIWKLIGDRWQIVFHQGTPINP